MFAIVETGGKQYKVSAGQKLKVEKLNATHKQNEPRHGREVGETVLLDKVLLVVDGEDVKIGTPYVTGAKVEAKISEQGKDATKIVFKYHSKTRQHKKKGHRQPFTELEILNIK